MDLDAIRSGSRTQTVVASAITDDRHEAKLENEWKLENWKIGKSDKSENQKIMRG